MGTQKTLGAGLLIPERCQFSALAANTATTTTSDYTEANPRPGLPVVGDSKSQLRLEMSGAQGIDVDVRVVKAGLPAREGVQLAYKDDTGTSGEWLTHEAPIRLTAQIPLDWGNDDTQIHDIAVIPDTQQVIVARERTAGVRLMVIDSDTHAVTEQSATLADGTDWNFPALAVIPVAGGYRIVCIYGGASYYSDDLGASWTTQSTQVTTETTTTYGYTSACVYRNDIVLFVEDTGTPETIHHLVSTDGGATFNLVGSTAALGVRVDTFANEDGLHVVWVDQGTAVEHRLLGTAFEPLDAVTQTAVATGSSWQECTMWSDATGTLYALYSGSTTLSPGFMSVSYDTGATWTSVFKGRVFTPDDTNDHHGHFRAAYANGQAFVLAGTHNGSAWATDRAMVFVLGGWTNVSLGGDLLQQLQVEHFGWGVHDRASSDDGATYFPVYTPTNMGWTTVGAGTSAVSDTERALNISTSANASSHSRDLGTAVTDIVGRARLEVVTGGSTTLQDIAITVRIADASSFEYEAEILFLVSGGDVTITVVDINSAATTNTTITAPTDYIDIEWWANTNDEAILVVYREPGANVWGILSAVAMVDAGATANNSQIEWGHIASGTAESNWRELHWVAAAGSNKPNLTNAIASRFSRAFNARPEPIPIVGTSTGNAFLAVVSGPAAMSETANIDAHHDHPIEHVHAELFPGLDTTWRSTSTAAQVLTYDLGEHGWVGHSVGLFIAGANFRTAVLASSTDGSSYTTEATLDLAEGFVTDLQYTLTGDMVYPDTANTSDADRWLWEQEKRKGLIICTGATGPATSATRITSQTSGGWTQSTTVIPMLQLEDVTNITPLAGTLTAVICSPSGLVLAHQTAVKARRYWRVTIPAGTAGEDTPEGESYYEASIISLCRAQGFGAEIGWGNSDEAVPNQREREDERGTLYSREMGIERRTWRIGGFSAGPTNHGTLRATVNMNYTAAASLPAYLGHAGFDDIFHHLRGLWRVLKGGELPCIAAEPLPTVTNTTLTDPSRFLYGRIGGSVRGQRLTGNYDGGNGNAEVLRVDDITIRELV